jgi:ATP-dependent Clp protease adaptor protein ClpS
MTSTETIVRPKIAPKTDLVEPSMYNVIYMNDDTTTMEFVIESLKIVFDYSEEDAAHITIQIHNDGSAVVATLPYEMAEQKGIEVTLLARNNGFPLNVKLEAAQ